MFKKLQDHIEKLQIKNAPSVDTKRFNDPMAEKIEWHPMKPGGANFKTHVLKQKSVNIYKYAPSIGALLFSGLFFVIGVVMLLVGLGVIFNNADAPFILVIFGGIFALVGYFAFKQMSTPIQFNVTHGYLWMGNKKPQLAGNVKDQQKVIYFSEIHAIQIISERIKSNKSSYDSYEINFVLRDGTRFHVIDHGNHQHILQDVSILSKIINKPIWDASLVQH